MVKANAIKKAEALRLREGGMKITAIVDKTGLSKATLKRLFKKNNLISDKLSLSHIKSVPLQNKDLKGNEKADPTIKSEPLVSENNVNGTKNEGKDLDRPEIEFSNSFCGVKIIFDTKTGGFTIERGEKKAIDKNLATSKRQSDNKSGLEAASEQPITPGLGQQFKTAPDTRQRDIDAPESPLDSIFKRNNVEILIPLGLVICGYMMKSENPQDNAFRGDQIRKNGLGWLSGIKGGQW